MSASLLSAGTPIMARPDKAQSSSSFLGTISAENYKLFLNEVAANSDPYHFYNPRMAWNNGSWLLLRLGTLGSYRYVVLQETENSAVPYLTFFSAARFCNWVENRNPYSSNTSAMTATGAYSLAPENAQPLIQNNTTRYRVSPLQGANIDPALAANNLFFQLLGNENFLAESAHGSNSESTWEAAAIGVGFWAVLAGFGACYWSRSENTEIQNRLGEHEQMPTRNAELMYEQGDAPFPSPKESDQENASPLSPKKQVAFADLSREEISASPQSPTKSPFPLCVIDPERLAIQQVIKKETKFIFWLNTVRLPEIRQKVEALSSSQNTALVAEPDENLIYESDWIDRQRKMYDSILPVDQLSRSLGSVWSVLHAHRALSRRWNHYEIWYLITQKDPNRSGPLATIPWKRWHAKIESAEEMFIDSPQNLEEKNVLIEQAQANAISKLLDELFQHSEEKDSLMEQAKAIALHLDLIRRKINYQQVQRNIVIEKFHNTLRAIGINLLKNKLSVLKKPEDKPAADKIYTYDVDPPDLLEQYRHNNILLLRLITLPFFSESHKILAAAKILQTKNNANKTCFLENQVQINDLLICRKYKFDMVQWSINYDEKFFENRQFYSNTRLSNDLLKRNNDFFKSLDETYPDLLSTKEKEVSQSYRDALARQWHLLELWDKALNSKIHFDNLHTTLESITAQIIKFAIEHLEPITSAFPKEAESSSSLSLDE